MERENDVACGDIETERIGAFEYERLLGGGHATRSLPSLDGGRGSIQLLGHRPDASESFEQVGDTLHARACALFANSGQRLLRTDVCEKLVNVARMEPVATRLKRLREAASPRLSVRALAEELSWPSSTYANYEDARKFKKPYLPLDFARLLVRPLGARGIEAAEVLALAGVGEGLNSNEEEAAAALDLVAIAEIDQDYGMGGTFTDNPVEVQVHHFPRLWIESITPSPPSLLTIARGKGDSMDPTIRDRDMVIIDRSRRKIDEADAIWALTVGDIGMIKRLRLRGSMVVIQSDNERVSDETVHADEINIVGRIVFIGRRT